MHKYILRYIEHPPVDDAMPERLPQVRLTKTVESSGLIKKDNTS